MRQRLDADSATSAVDDPVAADSDASSDGLPNEIATPPRPRATTPIVERTREWVEWFGLTRLLTSAAAVVRRVRGRVVPRAYTASAERGEPAGCERESVRARGDVERRDRGAEARRRP